MPRPLLAALLLVSTFGAAGAPTKASSTRWTSCTSAAQGEGQSRIDRRQGGQGGPVLLRHRTPETPSSPATIHGTPAWDRAAGLSFWVKGDGSDHFGGLELIYDDDYAVRYDFAFPSRARSGPRSSSPGATSSRSCRARRRGRSDPAGDNKPSKSRHLFRQVVVLGRLPGLLLRRSTRSGWKTKSTAIRSRLHAGRAAAGAVLAKLKAGQADHGRHDGRLAHRRASLGQPRNLLAGPAEGANRGEI